VEADSRGTALEPRGGVAEGKTAACCDAADIASAAAKMRSSCLRQAGARFWLGAVNGDRERQSGKRWEVACAQRLRYSQVSAAKLSVSSLGNFWCRKGDHGSARTRDGGPRVAGGTSGAVECSVSGGGAGFVGSNLVEDPIPQIQMRDSRMLVGIDPQKVGQNASTAELGLQLAGAVALAFAASLATFQAQHTLQSGPRACRSSTARFAFSAATQTGL